MTTQKKIIQKSKVVKKKLVPIPRLKAKLWKLVSEYVLLRDCDKNGMLTCCSTGRVDHIKSKNTRWNSGHFFAKEGSPALYFEENNINAQWAISNMKMKRNITWDYFLYMEKKYGRAEIDRLAALRGKPFHFSRQWLEDKIEHYEANVKALKLTKGL